MVGNETKNAVIPPEGDKKNFYGKTLLIGIGGVFSGAMILLFYLAFLLPAFRENLRAMGIIALFLAPLTFLVNYLFSIRKSKRLIEWMKQDHAGKPIEEDLWNDARECAVKLPRLSASFSLVLWPSAMILMAIIMFIVGKFGWYQVLITGISGILIGPLNALAFFYGLRMVMFDCLKRLAEYPFTPKPIDAPLVSLRFKLVFSYTCLVLCPMLFAVLLDRHQQDKYVTQDRVIKTESAIKVSSEIWNRTKSWDAVGEFVRSTAIPNAQYFAVGRTGKLIFGDPPKHIKNHSLKRLADGFSNTLYIHQIDMLMVAKPIGDKDAWLVAVFGRLDTTRGFLARNRIIILLLIALGFYGVYLGMEASRDIMRPVDEMMKSSDALERGAFSTGGTYLNDDELGILGEVFNKLLLDIKKQLEISEKMVEDIRGAVIGLGRNSDGVYETITKQRMGVGDQMMGLHQAQSVSGQITDAARSIQEKAGMILDMADTTSGDCDRNQETLDNTIEAMKLIGNSMEEISQRMDELMSHYKDILEVVKLIEDINERTDLLSLNASLEAVGAKRIGSRFAVVAKEVRRLADKTAESTTEIQFLFQSIRDASEACLDTIEGGHERVEHALDMMRQLSKSFETILKNAKATSDAVAQIHIMTTQQTTSCLQMQDTINEVADAGKIVKEGADFTEETVKSLSELTTGLKSLVKTEEEQEKQT